MCNFYCHYSLACFVHHAENVHNNYFDGAKTKLIEEESFEFIITDLDQKQLCLEVKAVNRTTKKSYI